MTDQQIIVTINPGSTSTKLAWFKDEHEMERDTLRHDAASLSKFRDIWSQYPFRRDVSKEWLQRMQIKPSAVVGIGGLLKPVASGTYRVNDAMLADARSNKQGSHASNLGCALASDLASVYGCPAFIVDPVSVDEFEEVARYSGHPLIERRSLSHSLNLHAAARRAATDLGKRYEEASFVIAHLGGGISVVPIRGGRIIDANDASSDGPFSPERTGGLPLQQFITLCYSGQWTQEEARRLVMGNGGLKAYFGTNSAEEVERLIGKGDERARLVFDAMAYQIAKEIGAMTTVLAGKLDAIVLTGGRASSDRLISALADRVRFIARILTYPGEDEMLALAQGALRVLRQEEPAKEY